MWPRNNLLEFFFERKREERERKTPTWSPTDNSNPIQINLIFFLFKFQSQGNTCHTCKVDLTTSRSVHLKNYQTYYI